MKCKSRQEKGLAKIKCLQSNFLPVDHVKVLTVPYQWLQDQRPATTTHWYGVTSCRQLREAALKAKKSITELLAVRDMGLQTLCWVMPN
jgi:hypothetical protein